MKKINLAIVGVTGMVGRMFLKVLEERDFPVNNLYLFASKRSVGKKMVFKNKEYLVEELTENSFDKQIDIALFSAGATISKKFSVIAKEKGCTVIDNSSAWRMEEDVPLVVPEVNPEDALNGFKIIANPNCSTIQAVVALKPLDNRFKIKRVVYSTYQAVSGAGILGYKDLENGIKGQKHEYFAYPIFNNCIPQIDVFEPNGYTKEEMKMINETRKILHKPKLKVTSTTVRVPVFNSHSISINIEFEKNFDIKDVIKTLKNAPSITVLNNDEKNEYPIPTLATGKDNVFIGRIRRDESVENGLNIWVVADNIRKGAATNTVQIAELLIKNNN